jgi:catalase
MPTPADPHRPADADAARAAAQATSVSGPSTAPGEDAATSLSAEAQRRIAVQKAGADRAARAFAYNENKAAEHGRESALHPPGGVHLEADDEVATASTVTEDVASDKLGEGVPLTGHNMGNAPLDRVRADASGRAITTNQGVPVADNQNSLKVGLRGPTALEDFILREKITHFDHERIPERVVHARGSAAHGFFECSDAAADLTMADPFGEVGRRTPVFVRFSTVAGERGSADAVRDTRGFAVKFYTRQGNWDLVGNNIPVFFIQDAMKFPDLVHSVKPEPHHGMPQASSAHDTFWDFVSLMPESIHHVLWVMSDRGIPRSYRTMAGFGVNTYRLVNAEGQARFVKFHWLPKAGTHSLVWDEAVKINGADPDFHRRDLWEAIESGAYPEWELAVQTFTEEEAEAFPFDVLDATKIVPEEMVPLRVLGRLVLDRNPDNFFAETEQVAFCVAHVVPGIDFSNDPLLQGRIHSYLDTQISRLGGPNFHEIPINGPVAQVHNNQRDGMHRQAIHRGRVSYEPNSLAGGCPHQAGMAGFRSFPERVAEPDKLRGKPEKFADHYSQATLFYRSQSPVEQRHIAAALRFELTRVTVPAVRERVVAVLRNVDEPLAQTVADGLGMVLPAAQPRALATPAASPVEASPALSLLARPGDGRLDGRRVALLAADGIESGALRTVREALLQRHVVARVVAPRLGLLRTIEGEPLAVEATVEAMPSVLWDAVVVAGGPEALPALLADGQVLEFLRDQWRHAKPMLVLGRDATLLRAAGIPVAPEAPGLVFAGEPPAEDDDMPDEADVAAPAQGPGVEALVQRFVEALTQHRHFARELDPPPV